MLGPLPRDEVTRWMGRARIISVPSVTAANGDTEGLPTTAVEALASGLPVVGTKHAGIPEAVIDGLTGLLVPERDTCELADRLKLLLDDDGLWHQMALAGRRHAEDEFDLVFQTAKLEEIYDAVVRPAI